MTSSFGDRLRLERESRQVTLEEIAARTEIDERFLRALERNEFDALPGQAFGKFYIRAYAAVLGFDPRALIADYDEARRRHGPRAGRPDPGARERPRRRVEAALARWREARESARVEAEQESTADVTARDVPIDDEAGASSDEPAIAMPEPSFEAAAEAAPPPPEAAPGIAELEEPGAPERRADPPPIPEDVAAPAPAEAGPGTTGSAHDEAVALAAILGPASSATAASAGRARYVRWGLVALGLVASAVVVGLVMRNDVPSQAPVARPPARESGPEQPPPPALAEDQGRAAEPPAETANTPPIQTRPARAANTESRAASRLEVPESGVGLRVVNQRLDGRAARFEEGSVVVFWTRVVGGSRGERIRHVWLHAGRHVQTVTLELGGASWRTHSRTTVRATGAWEVEARDAGDRVLARASFDCVPAGR